MPRRYALPLTFAVGLLLTLLFYRSALFQGGQFAYRDAGHFYYPLYQKVEQEWDSGRWPLWSLEENAGMPLLGNPTAAVLYPGKLIYRMLPYAWGARVYTTFHTLLAFGAMMLLARHLGLSWVGTSIASLSYAFGAPILFQYCNIIFLVGAAWNPLGILAIDAWLRLGRRSGLPVLALVLAMQVLGGDPESAYLLGLCAFGYALALRRSAARLKPGRHALTYFLIGIGLWIGLTIAAGSVLPDLREKKGPPVPTFWWNFYLSKVVAIAWALWAMVALRRWRRDPSGKILLRGLYGLGVAAAIGGAMTSAQLLPVMEFTSISARATGEGPHDIYPFSLEPYRVIEFVWPNVFGQTFAENRLWINAIPPRDNHRIWVPSLYIGGFAALLGLAAFGFRNRPVWVGWMSAILLVSLLGAFGDFASPLWWARCSPTLVNALDLGRHDLPNDNAIRLDGYLRDGEGSPYFFLATLLPGFGSFRYPSKLLSLSILALASLAGFGWDQVLAGHRERIRRLSVRVLIASGAVLSLTLIFRGMLIQWWTDVRPVSAFGPLITSEAYRDVLLGLGRGMLLPALLLLVLRVSKSRPGLAAGLAVGLLGVDLFVANAPSIRTVDQAEFDKTPRVLQIIAEAEKANPASGPYRIHRAPIWSPYAWTSRISGDRVRDFVEWERDTLQPKYGLPYGVEYTMTQGVAELFDFEWFFGPFTRLVSEETARYLRINPKERAIVYPRRGFDLWNSRYFVLPGVPAWTDAERGIASFLPRTEKIYPPDDLFQGPQAEANSKRWSEEEDVQILRNLDAYPRAWIVHSARTVPPIRGLNRAERARPMEEILYQNDDFWNDPALVVYDPRKIAWVESDDFPKIGNNLSGMSSSPREKVDISYESPQRVSIKVNLETPGIVVLADVYYPGWTLTIDGKPAPLLRVNRMMRGASVEAGDHTVVFSYEPKSFRYGLILSVAACIAWLGLALWSAAVRLPLSGRPART